MVFSSDPSNEFITAVVSKYGVNASNLVAYYVSSGTSNGNLVYEFDGTIGENGDIRHESTNGSYAGKIRRRREPPPREMNTTKKIPDFAGILPNMLCSDSLRMSFRTHNN